MKRKKTLLRIFLIPLLGIVLVQGVLPFTMLFWNRIMSKLENNAVSRVGYMIENRQVVLQNEMIEQWSSVSEESTMLTNQLKLFLTRQAADIADFISSDTLQQQYLETIFSDMIVSLQHNTASGLFVILTNDHPLPEEAKYHGFFLRDSAPQNRITTNTDLMLERGSKELARNSSVTLDTAWATDFTFSGKGVRSADDFFYEPYQAAMDHPDIDMTNLGYWSYPFILEDYYMDNHKMITYSIPLVYQEKVYGIVGVEVSLDQLAEYFPLRDLDENLNAGYMLAVRQENGNYRPITGKGSLYSAVTYGTERVQLNEQELKGLYCVEDVEIGHQGIYAMTQPLKIYSNNVPYKDTQWILCGFVTEESIFGLGRKLYLHIVVTAVFCAVLSIISVFILVKYVTRPIYRLMDSVRGGVEGIRSFKASNIIEIDELHEVVKTITESQRRTKEELMAEKERYRLAVESSQDIFFMYDFESKILEITNSRESDGKWDCAAHPEYMENSYVHPQDRPVIAEIMQRTENEISIDYRMRKVKTGKYKWVNLSGRILLDQETGKRTLVGYMHDIDQQKRLELMQDVHSAIDPITSLYKLDPGIETIKNRRQQQPCGIFLLLDIVHFGRINQQFGRVFGDIVLEQLSADILELCDKEKIRQAVWIRAGADEIAGWLPDVEWEQARTVMRHVKKSFVRIFHNNVAELDFKCGMTYADGMRKEAELLLQAQIALNSTQNGAENFVLYQQLSEKQKRQNQRTGFGEILPEDYDEKLGLVSLAFKLFAKAGYTPAILDILSLKLREAYGMTNLFITRYNKEKEVGSVEYIWQARKHPNLLKRVIHCSEESVTTYLEATKIAEVVSVKEIRRQMTGFEKILEGQDAVVFNMTDDGNYSGSIFFVGMNISEEKESELREIGILLQNRINQEKHDMSARAKSEFLARMSHEIRTPMNGIVGMTELALKPDQTEEKRIDCLNKIKDTSGYLLRLLNDILDMSKIESGKMQLEKQDFNLSRQIAGLRYLLAAKMEEKQITYTEQVTLLHEQFYGDEIRLKQILINILGNAVKYSEDGGHIILCVKEQELGDGYSDLFFSVEDDGIGIRKEDQKRIFRNFERVSREENIGTQGTGLGLAISSQLVRMMGSNIELESIPGKGSRFSFVLRFRQTVSKESVQQEAEQELDLRGCHVLVAEDNELNQEIIDSILKDMGAAVDLAGNGIEAVALFERSAPYTYDMIFMDIMMPKMDGLEAAMMIRKMDREDAKELPIIAMSANAFDEDVKRSLENGMNEHLSKPLDIRKLKRVLRQYTG